MNTPHDPVVVTEDHGRVRVITLNRSAALNAMNNAASSGLGGASARSRSLYKTLLGAPANREALKAFADQRPADFERISGL